MMAAIRTFLKHTVGQHSSDNNSGNTDSSSNTSLSTSERLNNQTNDGYSSTSTLGILTGHSDDSIRPLLHSHTTNRRKKFFSRLIDHPTTMNNQQEQTMDENICLMDKKLPKELLLR
jgi:hypothetical protein